MKREVEIVVISDVHLGTYGSHATEMVKYLKSIKPKTLILNGDIIDIWQFNKKYWPQSHMLVIKHITKLLTKGKTKIYYVTGNHDEMLRKFVGFNLGSLEIVNKIVLELKDNKKAWFFHGDIFDVSMQYSKWLAKLGSHGYDALIVLNRFVNFLLEKMGREKISLSKKIKNSVKSAVKFINKFEDVIAEVGIDNKYDYVVCGHIHQPEMRTIKTAKGQIEYLNSGDWVENLTALEYNDGQWKIYKYEEDKIAQTIKLKQEISSDLTSKEHFDNLVKEFKV